MNNIVKDSSIWRSTKTELSPMPGEIRVGIVRSTSYDKNIDSYYYDVEVTVGYKRFSMPCRQLSRFGDAFNYEEWFVRSQDADFMVPPAYNWSLQVGEVVVVAPLNSNYTNGVILGSFRHPSRKSKLKAENLHYASEMNGIETTIDSNGAYKITFKGAPINADALKAIPPGSPIPPAIYNPVSSGSYLTFASDGSFMVDDNLLQSFKIDKPNGKITLKSGTVNIEIDKKKQKVTTSSLDWESNTLKSYKISTTQYEMAAKATAKIKAPKIAIGYGSSELLALLIQLIDSLSLIVIKSPVGPCEPFGASPLWAQINLVKAQIQLIKGSL